MLVTSGKRLDENVALIRVDRPRLEDPRIKMEFAGQKKLSVARETRAHAGRTRPDESRRNAEFLGKFSWKHSFFNPEQSAQAQEVLAESHTIFARQPFSH